MLHTNLTFGGQFRKGIVPFSVIDPDCGILFFIATIFEKRITVNTVISGERESYVRRHNIDSKFYGSSDVAVTLRIQDSRNNN